ncbi:MAG TPA: hypothetical protein VGD40_12880 [Chryseosolibacter sp.]
MKIVYIDNNEAIGGMFKQVATQYRYVSSLTVTSGKMAVTQLLERNNVPAVIVINDNLQGATCKFLISFIRKQEHLQEVRLIVIANYLTPKQVRTYTNLGAQKCWHAAINVESIRALLESLEAGAI